MSVVTLDPKHNVTGNRQAYYDKISKKDMAPLWEVLRNVVTKEPKSKCSANIWKFDEVKKLMLEAGDVISAEEAERRVLILENPGLRGASQITGSLYAGLQLIMPGEVAPAHRHTQSALRFIIEGAGAYTAVDGEKTAMLPGDFVVTPSWTFHHHGHEGAGPTIWLDCLDIPIVALFNSTFREEHPDDEAPLSRPEGDALARYGSGLLPVGHAAASLNSPVFNYPYARTREALHTLARGSAPDAHLGHLMRYVNPLDGGWAMPTMATMIRLLPAGFSTLPYRSSDSMVFIATEGEGAIDVDGQRFEMAPHDIVVVPGWSRYTLHAASDWVVFSCSDRVALEKLGFFREQRFAA